MEDGHLAGMFYEYDYVLKIILKGSTSLATTVREIMSDIVFTLSSEQSLEDCMELMTERPMCHLPVMDSTQLVGLLSIGDVVKEISADKSLEIEQLETYIGGRGYSVDPLQHC